MLIVRLFYEFFKIGLFAVGGGMATLPFLYNLAGTQIGLILHSLWIWLLFPSQLPDQWV